jgi:hypothetical protein
VSFNVSSRPEGGEYLDVQREARSDEEGLAVLSSAPGETVRLTVEAAGFAGWRSEPLSLPHAQDVDLRADLSGGGAVLVRVLDSRGSPVGGVGVKHKSPGGEGHSSIVHGGSLAGDKISDVGGEALFEKLSPGRHLFQLTEASSGDGMAFTTVEVHGMPQDERGWTAVEVLEGQVVELELEAPALATLAGIVSEAGKPLAGVSLSLSEAQEGDDPVAGMSMMGMPGSGGPTAKTDGLGRYRFENAKAGDWELKVSHPTRAMDEVLELSLLEGENERDISLGVAIVEGHVVDEQGEPIAGARVKAERAQPRGRQQMRFALRMISDDGGDTVIMGGGGALPLTALTDSEGFFSLRGVTPDQDLQIEASSDSHQTARSEPFQVAADEIHKGVEVSMMGAGSVSVRAVGPKGLPASMVMVRGKYLGGGDAPPTPAFGMTRSDGTASIASMKPGPWELSFEQVGPGADEGEAPESQTVEIVAGETAEVEVELP